MCAGKSKIKKCWNSQKRKKDKRGYVEAEGKADAAVKSNPPFTLLTKI